MTKFKMWCLLMWKNFIIAKQEYKQTAFELLIPIVLVLVFVTINSVTSSSDELNPAVHYPQQEIRLCRNQLAISPRNSVLLDFVKRALPKTPIAVQKGSTELDRFLTNGSIPGIEFDNGLLDKNELPKVLRFSVRMPNTDNDWNTNTMWEIGRFSKKRENNEIRSAYLNCFMYFQNALEQEFIRTNSKAHSTMIPAVNFQRFPFPEVQGSSLIVSLLPMFIICSFLYSCQCTIKNVAIERESLKKETLKIMGLSSSVHWMACFGKSFIFMLLSFTVMISILKISNIFQHSNFLLLWIFGIIYVAANILFCFVVSLLFQKSSVASTIGSIAYMTTYLPYALVSNDIYKCNYALKFLICMCPNSALATGITSILFKERDNVGLSFGNLFTRGIDQQFSFGSIMIAMVFGMLVLAILVSYFEKAFPGDVGIPEKWYYPISPILRLISKKIGKDTWNDTEMKHFHGKHENFESEPTGLNVGIYIKKLSKEFGSKSIVSELSLKMFEDQITVLIGHNGAGKTTTISMLTGMCPPTSGTAFIDGNDIRTDIDKARTSMGICPQHNVFFNELTVVENFIFFCRLKGMIDSNDIDQEVKKYVRLLGLSAEADKQSHTLSAGVKRKLSIGIALCGKSKVVICQEPTDEMDPESRREVWDLFLKEKKGRTILLTTNSMDEADILGDRIAIMSNGELKSVGSSLFLKKCFGTGYRLVCIKTNQCKPNMIQELLKSFVHDVTMIKNTQTEVIFNIPEPHLPFFESIFKVLENSTDKLGISSFGCSLITLDEVFLNIETDQDSKTDYNFINKQENISTNLQTSIETNKHNLHKGYDLMVSQVMAIILKKFHYQRRNFIMMLLLGIISITLIAIYIPDRRSSVKSVSISSLDISFSTYDETVTVYENTNHIKDDSYQLLFGGKNKLVKTTERMSDLILNQYKNSYYETNFKYLIGFTESTVGSTIWYNNEPFHALPLALNTFNRALLKQYAGSEYDVFVTNKPFVQSKLSNDKLSISNNISIEHRIYNLFILFSLFWPMIFIGFYIKERENRAQLLQMITGANKIIYWMTSYLFDFAICIIVFLILFIVVYACVGDVVILKEPFCIFTLYNLSVLPFIYLLSFAFTMPATGETLTVFDGFLMIIIHMTITIIQNNKLEGISNFFYWMFMVVPQFSLADISYKLNRHFDNSTNSNKISRTEIYTNCLYLLTTGVISMLICIAKDYKLFSKMLGLFSKSIVVERIKNVDPDVQAEADRINLRSPTENTGNRIVLSNLSKKYGKTLAVNQLSIGVKGTECFGLLGTNGAGTSSVFKMLVGDDNITDGKAIIENVSIKENINQLKKIGYCPQFDGLIDDLTGIETLKIYSMLHGIPKDDIDSIITNLVEDLDFDKHLEKQIKILSGGMKRKLSTALALLGDPLVVLLDEPTRGMDPGAKYQLWKVITKGRDAGQSVILSSNNMKEFEALCTRLAIMVNGEIKCLGSTQHLKSKCLSGFLLTIKINNLKRIQSVKENISIQFPDSILKDEFSEIFTYHITNTNLKVSDVFGKLEKLKNELDFADYSLTHATLEQVFLFFSKKAQNHQ